MHVYRLQAPKNAYLGPFQNDPLTDLGLMMGAIPSASADSLPPATYADVVAVVEKVPGPWEKPTPQKDGITSLQDDEYLGFVSFTQYEEWFSTPLQRKALFATHRVELVEYEVPDQYAKVGGHQVAFRLDKAKVVRHYSEEEAIDER
jgi:hypothetical protein